MKHVLQIGCLAALAVTGIIAQPPAGMPPPHWGGSHFSFMGFGPDMSQPVTGAPYAAVQTTQFTQKLPDGNTIQHTDQSNVYRDAQGRVRIEHSFSGRSGAAAGQKSTSVSIFDPVGGVSYMLHPDSMKAVKSALRTRPSAGASPNGRAPRSRFNGATEAQAVTENLGTQTINNLISAGTRTTQTIPVGAIGNTQPIQIVREVWISQDLKVPVMIKTSDPRFGDTIMQLANVTQSNPDPSLFQVPSTYTVEAAPDRFGGRSGWPKGNAPVR